MEEIFFGVIQLGQPQTRAFGSREVLRRHTCQIVTLPPSHDTPTGALLVMADPRHIIQQLLLSFPPNMW